MSLTPEDNSGLVNADSYVTLQAFKDYCTARGIDPTELGEGDDASLEQLCRIGFQFVNTYGAYKSLPKNNDQSGEFPRVDLSDGMGRIFNVVPQRVKDAQCEAAIAQGQGVALFENQARGGQIVSETVGPISTTYAQGASPETLFQAVNKLLEPFLRDPACPRRPLPSFNDYADSGQTEPIFSVGMDDAPGVDPSTC
jgi:hypothetical protein